MTRMFEMRGLIAILGAFSFSAGLHAAGYLSISNQAGGYYHSVAVKSDGSVWTWGYSGPEGVLGNGTTNGDEIPVKLSLSGMKEVSAGRYHSLALSTNGAVWGPLRTELDIRVAENGRGAPVQSAGQQGDGVTLVEEGLGDVAPDKPSSACDRDFHMGQDGFPPAKTQRASNWGS
jgi:hypothetical protein